MRKCKFLSKAIYVNPADVLPYVEEQHKKFINDFVTHITYFRGKPIIVTHEKDYNDYGTILNDEKYKLTAFAHIVSRKINQNSKKRDLDIQLLQSCHWVKELIEKYNSNDPICNNCQYIKIADKKEGHSNVTYIYCRTVRYVIILQHAFNYKLDKNDEFYEYYFIKSAFYVNEESMNISILKKF